LVYPFPRPFSRFFLFTVARRMHPIDPRPFVLRQRPGPDWLGSGPEHEGLRWQHEPLPPRGVLRLQRAYGLPVPACTCRVLRPLPHVQVFCASFSPACLRRPVCVCGSCVALHPCVACGRRAKVQWCEARVHSCASAGNRQSLENRCGQGFRL